MYLRIRRLCAAGAACALVPMMTWSQTSPSADESPQMIPEVVVIGSVDRADVTDISPGQSAAPVPDAMEVLTRLPGANVNRNGPLSGQAQYRGLFGPRLAVTVDGAHVTPGGPNWMDAPLHYLPAGLTEKVTLTRGIAPVSAGPGIGGLIEAESRQSQFSASDELEFSGNGTVSLLSNDGRAAAAFFAVANSAHRLHVYGSSEHGEDLESAKGRIAATEYGRATYGVGYGFRWADSEISLNLSHTDTDPTGTPSLPLDIAYFDTDRVNAGFRTELGSASLSARIFTTDIEHGMSNFMLRDAPDFSQLPLPPFVGDDRRSVDVVADATGFVASLDFDVRQGRLAVGIDGNSESHEAVVKDPDFAPFFVDNFHDSEQRRIGAFAEWYGDLGSEWAMELGARYTRIESSSGAVDAFPARLADQDPAGFPPGTPPFAVKLLRDRFNASARDVNDDNVDVVVELERRLGDSLSLGFGYARKVRSPMYIERYLWIPLEVNAGLGDLNNYVGNVGLKPESSDQIELSLNWTFDKGFIAPRVFYRAVDDYIQGIASVDPIVIAVSANANGDSSPLTFANVDAELYGIDVVGRYALSPQWTIDATLNLVRGRRTDISDDLYRLAPPNGRVAMTTERNAWSVTAEAVLVARQSRISRTIVLDEPRSSNEEAPGYGLVNVYGQWQARRHWELRLGIENLLDRFYVNPLAGFNRVSGSSVPIGEHIPGPGRNAFLQLQAAW